MSAAVGAAAPRAPPRPLGPRLLLAAIALAVVASVWFLAVDWRALFTREALGSMARFVREFFPPDTSPAFLAKVAAGAWQTFAVAAVGTALAAALAALLSLPASGRAGPLARVAARLVLNVLRSVPELVWAALMVIAAGLGPFAGTLALALHTTGVLGRLDAETLENEPPEPAAALREGGAGRLAVFAYATLPLVAPQWIAYALYRLEMNIRMAAVLGFVGAGGLGQMLYVHLSLFQQAQVATLLAAMLGLVLGVDQLSAVVRQRLRPAHG